MPTKIYHLRVSFKAPGVRDQKWEFDSEAKRTSALAAIKSANGEGIKSVKMTEKWKND
jgi:hypothetical protein